MSVHAFFFFNDTATTEIYTLSLHDALPILGFQRIGQCLAQAVDRHSRDIQIAAQGAAIVEREAGDAVGRRSEEHTSELQSRQYLVCRLLLEKKKHTAAHEDKDASVVRRN